MKYVTVCSLDCPDACSLVVERDRDGHLSIRGNPNHPVTAGFTCSKIRNYIRRLQSHERITTPLLRKGGHWEPLGWDDALGLCADRIQSYREEPSSILHLHGEGAKGVLKYASNLFFGRLGASYATGSLCDLSGITACTADFGSLDHNDIHDILNAKAIVNWGKDLSRSSIHVASLVRKARKGGAQVVTVSPGGDGNRPFSDYCVRIRPGTDRFLAAAVVRLFMERKTIQASVHGRARNWKVFHDLLSQRSVEDLASVCQVSFDDIELLYNVYNRPEPAATLFGWGLQRYRYGGENVRFINALAFLSGNIGRSGGGSYFNIGSLRNFNLDWASEPGQSNRRTFPLSMIGRSIMEADNPVVKMIWVNAFNVVNQAPDSRIIREAFRTREFTVVVDAFMTDTAAAADMILPCTLVLEQEDMVGSFLHDYIHHSIPAVPVPRQARDDYWILSEVGKRLDPPIMMPPADDCFRASLESPYLDTTLEKLKEQRFVRALRPSVAYEGMRFHHADGLYRFPEALHDEMFPEDDFPLRLLSLVRRDAIHSQIAPEKQTDVPKVWISPDNPILSNLDMKKDVFLASPRGRIRVTVETLPGLHPEAAIYRRGDWMRFGGGINQLVEAGFTDMGNGVPYYSQCVTLEN
jgi:anaerobic selenocysteine-containing dehydrogenase